MQQTVQDWVRKTAGTQLFAVLANTHGAQAIKAYYRADGSRTPFGLYAETPYANWFEVMPVLVPLNDHSPFLNWVEDTPLRNWGWLARSPLGQATITAHLRGLTKVFMPDGNAVFFRYWDGRYLLGQLRYCGEGWREVLPVFSDYWVNGEAFTCPTDASAKAMTSPWWQVPQGLIDSLLKADPGPVIAQALKYLQKDRADLYWRFAPALLKAKILHLLVQSDGDREGLMTRIVTTLENE